MKAENFSLSGEDFEHDSVIKLRIIKRETLIAAILIRQIQPITIILVDLANFKLLSHHFHLNYVLVIAVN